MHSIHSNNIISFIARHASVDVHYHQCFQIVISLRVPFNCFIDGKSQRLRHLFAEETGIPFSQYVLWKRIKLVMTQVIKGKLPMANSAIQNGFTDQAHFARLFKRTFGVNARNMLKNSRFVQFLTPEV